MNNLSMDYSRVLMIGFISWEAHLQHMNFGKTAAPQHRHYNNLPSSKGLIMKIAFSLFPSFPKF